MALKTLKPAIAVLNTAVGSAMPQVSGADSGKRLGANARGYTYRWQQESKAFLRVHPLCQCPDCAEGEKRLRVSEVVDHDPPHHGNMQRFWDRSTWRALAKECHDAKTAREDGGFGNAPGGRVES